MDVQWAEDDVEKAVNCQVVDTFTGETKWQGLATVPSVEAGPLAALSFDPSLPPNGQLGLTAGTYQWTCDLEDYARSRVNFDIIAR